MLKDAYTDYKNVRIHYTIGYVTPREFLKEQEMTNKWGDIPCGTIMKKLVLKRGVHSKNPPDLAACKSRMSEFAESTNMRLIFGAEHSEKQDLFIYACDWKPAYGKGWVRSKKRFHNPGIKLYDTI